MNYPDLKNERQFRNVARRVAAGVSVRRATGTEKRRGQYRRWLRRIEKEEALRQSILLSRLAGHYLELYNQGEIDLVTLVGRLKDRPEIVLEIVSGRLYENVTGKRRRDALWRWLCFCGFSR